ncbi:hypothetical protein C8250_029115 [Streptomyces sp. So13.3]|uniref:hypothetical protein n=1 Tax=Streptomyces sp. So13.3 TaxID=2136173 RepID=UPI001105AC98|nr:hypothetical protein [Streptomyces sp. So13.3]QNA75411.1 hypothetical protein C8250_029115 [Streptomyces sp. So13.3]
MSSTEDTSDSPQGPAELEADTAAEAHGPDEPVFDRPAAGPGADGDNGSGGRPRPAGPGESEKEDSKDEKKKEKSATRRDGSDEDFDGLASVLRGGTTLDRPRRNAVSASGNSYYFEQFTLGADSRAEIHAVDFDPRDVAQYREVHQTVDQQSQMAARLREHHVVALSGEPGSGRQSTALVLLAGVCGNDRIKILHTEAPSFAQALVAQAEKLLTSGDGFLVDLGDQPVKLSTVAALSGLAHSRNAYVVVIGERGPVDPDQLQPYAVAHRRPDPNAVLRAHLRAALALHSSSACTEDECGDGHVSAFVTGMLADQQVQRIVGGAPSVRAVVDFAVLLAEQLHAGQTGLDEAVGRWRNRLRRLAKHILQKPPEGSQHSTLDPHRQAFLIAYALFNGHPLADVFWAADMLSATVLPLFETREPPIGVHLFDRDLDQLIPPAMRGAGLSGASAQGEDNPRRALLGDEKLMLAVIEVAWHDYDSLRPPLRMWLTRMVGTSPLERIHVRAAQIAGILLGHDFDSVYRDLVSDWARGTAPYRQCAALALAMAAGDPQLAPRVRRQVRSWAGSPDWRLQDSAARTFGTSVGIEDVNDALRSLRELGTRPELALRNSVAFSMALLFLADGTEPVADALERWITADNEYLARHAIRTMLILGRYSVGADRRDRPVLAHLAMQDSAREKALVLLWRRALLSQGHSARAWDLLRRWLLGGDADPELGGFLEAFVPHVCTGQLSRRLMFNLDMWIKRYPESGCIRRVRKHLDGGSTQGGDQES